VLVRAVVVWLLLLVLAILNGAFREAVLNPALGPQMGHVVSTVLLSGLIVAVASVTVPWVGPVTSRGAFAVGILWMALTLAFEFGAGYWLFHQPLAELVNDYNLTRGRIWPLVLVATVLSPVLVGKRRHLWP
jgi:hypothetical protein